jgi:endoribonuclease Dicer
MDPAQEDDSITEHVVDTNDFLDSDDDDDLPVMGSAPSTPKEKRRAQNAIFQSWMTSAAGREVATRRTRDDMPKDGSGDVGSITSLLAQHRKGDDKIVKNPREYQIELFERAKQQNTIAVLDTGSGKTLIAVLLLRHVIDEEIENRSKGHSPKVSFFLVASVTLVFQQFSVLECNLDHKVSRLCGSDNANKDPQRWMKELHENKVIICTSEILFQALSFGYISMKQINLLIFDEAHHTKKNHSYARYTPLASMPVYL